MILSRDAIIKALLDGDIVNSECPLPDTAKAFPINLGKKEDKGEFKEWCDTFIGPCSMDVTLGDDFLIENPKSGVKMDDTTDRFFVDTKTETASPKSQFSKVSHVRSGDGRVKPISIGPGRRAVGYTAGTFQLSEGLGAQIMGRLSVDLWGLSVSSTFAAPGFIGHLRIPVQNQTQRLFTLHPGVRYAQLIFFKCTAETAYTGAYNLNKDAEWTAEALLPQPLTD